MDSFSNMAITVVTCAFAYVLYIRSITILSKSEPRDTIRKGIIITYKRLRDEHRLCINDTRTQYRFKRSMVEAMRNHVEASNINIMYSVECSADNNPPSIVNRGDIRVDVYFRFSGDSFYTCVSCDNSVQNME